MPIDLPRDLTIPEILQFASFLSSEIRQLLTLAKSKGADPAQMDALLANYDVAHQAATDARATY